MRAPLPSVPYQGRLIAASGNLLLVSNQLGDQVSDDGGQTWEAANLPLMECADEIDCSISFGEVADGILPVTTSWGSLSWYSLASNAPVGQQVDLGSGWVTFSAGPWVQRKTDAEPVLVKMDGTTVTVTGGDTAVLLEDGTRLVSTYDGSQTTISHVSLAQAATTVKTIPGPIKNLVAAGDLLAYYSTSSGQLCTWSLSSSTGNCVTTDVPPYSDSVRITDRGILITYSSADKLFSLTGSTIAATASFGTDVADYAATQDAGLITGTDADADGSYLVWLYGDGSSVRQELPWTVQARPSGLALTPTTLIGTHEPYEGAPVSPDVQPWYRPAVSTIGNPTKLGTPYSHYFGAEPVASTSGWVVAQSSGLIRYDANGANPQNIGGSPSSTWYYPVRISGSRVLTQKYLYTTGSGWASAGAIKDIHQNYNLSVTDTTGGATAVVTDTTGGHAPVSLNFAGSHAYDSFAIWGDWVAGDDGAGNTTVYNWVTGQSYTNSGSLELLGDGFAVTHDAGYNGSVWEFGSGEVTALDGSMATSEYATDGDRIAYNTTTEYVVVTVDAQPALTATPKPTITGSAQVGATLTADAGTWEPAPVSLSYQWLRDGVAIDGASAATYQVTAADVGAKLTVSVTGSKTGYEPSVQLSDPTDTVVTAADQELTATPTPTISGTAAVGETLTAQAGTWEPAPVLLSYQWLRNGSVIAGATSASYQVTADDVGATLSVAVTGAKSGYTSATKTSDATATVAAADQELTATPTPTISGTAQVGETLSADAGTWSPAPVALAYQWLRDGEPISGATAASYTAQVADVDAKLSVAVTGSKSGYTSVTKTSAETDPVAAAPVPELTATPTPTISGTAQVGQVLTAKPGSWAPAPVELAYQWLRNGAVISGATSSTYEVKPADVGAKLSVSVTGSKAGYVSVTKTSTQTATVIAAPLPELTATPTPTISGTAQVGQKLTAKPGTWKPSPVSLSYQWLRDGAAIDGETNETYEVTSVDVGAKLSVAVTGSKSGYVSATKVSAETAAVTEAPLPNLTATPKPTISGKAQVGATLSATAGSWQPAPVALSYQWLRNGSAIAGATAPNYPVTSADLGAKLSVAVTGSKWGFVSSTQTSAQTGTVTKGKLSLTPTPTISPSGKPKAGDTLSVATGIWGPGEVSFKYQWFQSKSGKVTAIAGATKAEFEVPVSLIGAKVRVEVTGTMVGGDSVTVASDWTSTVVKGKFVTTTPTVVGDSFGVGLPVSVSGIDDWTPKPTKLKYQWYRVSSTGVMRKIAGATKATYTPAPAIAGFRLQVVVTGSRTGYETAQVTSAISQVVAPALKAGKPKISDKTPKVSQTLTARPGSWSTSAELSYQWYAKSTSGKVTKISAATGKTYKVAAKYRRSRLAVAVTGVQEGYASVTKFSAYTAKVK